MVAETSETDPDLRAATEKRIRDLTLEVLAVPADAVALVRGSRHAEAAEAFIDFVGEQEALLLAARRVYRLPARRDLPLDSLPPWVDDVERTMKVLPMDWAMLAREGATWMGYWDQHVRGTGRAMGGP